MGTPEALQIECLVISNRASASGKPFCRLQSMGAEPGSTLPELKSDDMKLQEKFPLNLEESEDQLVQRAIEQLQSRTLNFFIDTLITHAYNVGANAVGHSMAKSPIVFNNDNVSLAGRVLKVREDMRVFLHMIKSWDGLRSTISELMRQTYEHAITSK